MQNFLHDTLLDSLYVFGIPCRWHVGRQSTLKLPKNEMGESAAERKILFLPVKDKRDNFWSRCWIWIFVHEFSSFSSLLLATFVLSNIEILFKNIYLLRVSFEYWRFPNFQISKRFPNLSVFVCKMQASIQNTVKPLTWSSLRK